MSYKITNNSFSADINEFVAGDPSTGMLDLPQLNVFKNINFGAEALQYNNTPSEMYNKLYSIFLNIINKSNDDTMKSNPKKYFDMLLSYSLQKGFKRVYNNNFEENYIPEIVGIYDYRPDDKYNGMIVVFDVPNFSKNKDYYTISIEVSEPLPDSSKTTFSSVLFTSQHVLQHTATYMPYIYSKEKLNSVATNKNFRCLLLNEFYPNGKRTKIKENNIYDITLEVSTLSKKDETTQFYNLINLDTLSELNSEISKKSPITNNFGYKELNVNDFGETINMAVKDKSISNIRYLGDYFNITYKYATSKGLFGQSNPGFSENNSTGWIFEQFLITWNRSGFKLGDNINIVHLIKMLNNWSSQLYAHSLYPRGQRYLICPREIPFLVDGDVTIKYGNRKTYQNANTLSYIYFKDSKYFIADNKYLIEDLKTFKSIDYYEIKVNNREYNLISKISIADIQYLNISKFITYLITLAEQGCYIDLKQGYASGEMPIVLGSLVGDRNFNRFDGCEFEEIKE